MERIAPLALLVLLSIANAEEATSPLPQSGPLPEVDDSAIGYETPEAALKALRNKPGTQIRQERGWTIVQDEESEHLSALWSFTPEDHPAYPAAVKRILSERDGAIYLEMKVLCGGPKDECDALVREFQTLNDQIRASMQGGSP